MCLRSNQNTTIEKEFLLYLAKEHLTLSHQKYEILLPLCTTVHTCVNKVSHLCYWSKTINDPCLKEVVGELRVALENIEPSLQRLFSLKQARITENNSWSLLFALVVVVCRKTWKIVECAVSDKRLRSTYLDNGLDVFVKTRWKVGQVYW